MSYCTYLRPGLSNLNDVPCDAPLVILGHGGGEKHWGAKHCVTAWALRHMSPVVLSVELPYHGQNASQRTAVPFDSFEDKQWCVRYHVTRMKELLLPVVRNRYCIFLGYSTAGIVFLKIFRALRVEGRIHPSSLLVCIGASLAIGSTTQMIQHFWRPSTYESAPKRHEAMRSLHRSPALPPGEKDDLSWRNCVQWAGFATGEPTSVLFSTEQERKLLFLAPIHKYTERQQAKEANAQQFRFSSSRPCADYESNYVFFISGDRDQPFPPEECVVECLKALSNPAGGNGALHHEDHRRDIAAERVTVLENTDHFQYFIPQKSGGNMEKMLEALGRIVQNYGERGLLARFQASSALVPPINPRPALTPKCAHVPFNPRKVIIIGSGVFGVSTALALQRVYPGVAITMLEKASVVPNPHAASTDNNRIVRPDYGSDVLYTHWSVESIRRWKEFNRAHGEEVYHETGVLFLADDEAMKPKSKPKNKDSQAKGQEDSFECASFRTLQSPPFSLPLVPLKPQGTSASSSAAASGPVSSSPLASYWPYWLSQDILRNGYYNPQAGWVNPARAISLCLLQLQTDRSGLFQLRTSAAVKRIEVEPSGLAPGKRVAGVTLESGEFLAADLVIAATGCWTPQLIPELARTLHPSAQPVIFVRPNNDAASAKDNAKLTPVDAAKLSPASSLSIYEDRPLKPIDPALLSMGSTSAPPATTPPQLFASPFPVFSYDLSRFGFYGFSLDQFGILKLGHHGFGLSEGLHQGPDKVRTLNRAKLEEFAAWLHKALPHVYRHGELVEAKTCYYCDSIDGHFLLDYHPGVEGLFVATGGNGHAFKFLPVIGDIIVGLLACGACSHCRPSFAKRFEWRVPAADNSRQYDVCRSTGVNPPSAAAASSSSGAENAVSSSEHAQSKFRQSMDHYLVSTGQEKFVKAKL